MIKTPEQIRGFNFVLISAEGKNPIEKAWQKKTHRIDCPILQKHLSEGKNYGVQSNGSSVVINDKPYFLIMIDFDKKDFMNKVLSLFPETFTTTSGSSKQCFHLWLASDNNKPFKIGNENAEMLADIIGAGNQIIAPGSRHPSGSIYSVVKSVPIAFMPYAEIEAILKPYDKSPKKIKKPKKQYAPKGISNDIIETIFNSVSMERCLTEIGIDSSKNPTNCFGHASAGGKCFSWTDEAAHCFHCQNLNSGWNKYTLIREAKKLSDKETFEWFAEKAGMTEELKQSRKEYVSSLEGESKKENIGGETTADWSEFLIYDDEGKPEKVSIDKVADYILEHNNFITIYGVKSETIYLFEGGIWIKNGKRKIKTDIEKLLGMWCKNNVVLEITEKIKRKTGIDSEEFEKLPADLICLENGVLNINTRKLTEHSPKYYFKTKLPVIYNPEADCPKIKEFFKASLYPEHMPIMQEWFGYTLYRVYSIKKAMILYGVTDTGKTQVMNLLTAFLNKKNTSGLSLQRISHGDRFRLIDLKDKLANLYDDLSSEDMVAGGFKIATGGGYITAEYKFGDQIQFLNFAKNTFAGNKIPSVKDIDSEDAAYFNRWLPIPFDNQIPLKEQDKKLINKLTTEEELSGLLNWALEGLDRLQEKGVFSDDRDWKTIKNIMERQMNSIAAFCHDILIKEKDGRISKEAMFEIYSEYMKIKKDSGFPTASKAQLGRQLPKYANYVSAKVEKIRFWEGVGIRDYKGEDDTYNTLFLVFNKIRKIDNTKVLDKVENKALYPLFTSNPSQETKEQDDLNEQLKVKVEKIQDEPIPNP